MNGKDWWRLTLFINGLSGNVNHVDVLATARRLTSEAEAARVGTVLAAAVLKTYKHSQPVEPALFRAVTRPVRVPVRAAPSPQRIAEARGILGRRGKGALFAEVIHA